PLSSQSSITNPQSEITNPQSSIPGLLPLDRLDLADPDVAELHRVAMVLEPDRLLLRVRLERRRLVPSRVPLQLAVVVHRDPVVDHCDVPRLRHLAVPGEPRR